MEGIVLDNKIKHLEMIEEIIKRMASCSFKLKGWAVTLIAGIFALASKDANQTYFVIAYVPIIVFWGLDAFYLQKDRLYGALYDKVRVLDNDKIDFSMKATTEEFTDWKYKYSSCLISKTVLWFYFPLAIVSSLVIVISYIVK